MFWGSGVMYQDKVHTYIHTYMSQKLKSARKAKYVELFKCMSHAMRAGEGEGGGTTLYVQYITM